MYCKKRVDSVNYGLGSQCKQSKTTRNTLNKITGKRKKSGGDKLSGALPGSPALALSYSIKQLGESLTDRFLSTEFNVAKESWAESRFTGKLRSVHLSMDNH